MTVTSNYAAQLQDRAVMVYGLGASGIAAVKMLRAAGIPVWVDDDDQDKVIQVARTTGAQAVATSGAHDPLADCAALILAPGIPLHFPAPHAVVTRARTHGVEIMGDIEVWARFYPHAQTVGITGTNGKSTTTALTAHILNQAGRRAVACGNIGTPICGITPDHDTIMVIEMSSFQLDLCPTFRPSIAAHLNITPDHLDRHGTLENYIAVKERIFDGSGTGFCGMDDDASRGMLKRVMAVNPARTMKGITVNDPSGWSFGLDNLPTLRGRHNIQNALFAASITRAIGLTDKEIHQGLITYPGLPHRQFLVRTIGLVDYINDSKATNADATEKALMTFDPIYWIVGGLPKAGGLQGLEPFAPRIAHAYLIGTAADDFAGFMAAHHMPHTVAGTLDQAVAMAHQAAQQSRRAATVLLSPACASYDQFKNYEHRGHVFEELVRALMAEAA